MTPATKAKILSALLIISSLFGHLKKIVPSLLAEYDFYKISG
jgi:hypothetical protein